MHELAGNDLPEVWQAIMGSLCYDFGQEIRAGLQLQSLQTPRRKEADTEES
jgi:hypothetical protein